MNSGQPTVVQGQFLQRKDYIVKHITILETIERPARETTIKPLALDQEAVIGVLTAKKQHSLLINESKLNGFEIAMNDHNRPAIGCINGRYGVFTRREIHPNSGKYERGIILSPFGAPNGQLWVRETWRIGAWDENTGQLAIDYKATPEITKTPWVTIPDDLNGEKFNRYWVAISDELDKKGVACDADGRYLWETGQSPLNWKSSMTMPKWASRLLLDVSDVIVEPVVGSMPIQWQFTATFSLNNWNFVVETH